MGDVAKIRPLGYKKLVKVFIAAGFELKRQRGDHLILVKNGVKRPVIIPMYDPVPVFIILNNLRTAGLSRDEYLQLLRKK